MVSNWGILSWFHRIRNSLYHEGLEQWAELENRLKSAALEFISKPHHRPPENLVQILVDNSIIDADFQKRFSDLCKTRNSIAHGFIQSGMDVGYVMQVLFNLVNALPPWKEEKKVK